MRLRPGVEIAGLTDVGCQRENNEDSYGYWESDDDAVFAVTKADRSPATSQSKQFNILIRVRAKPIPRKL